MRVCQGNLTGVTRSQSFERAHTFNFSIGSLFTPMLKDDRARIALERAQKIKRQSEALAEQIKGKAGAIPAPDAKPAVRMCVHL